MMIDAMIKRMRPIKKNPNKRDFNTEKQVEGDLEDGLLLMDASSLQQQHILLKKPGLGRT
jgi:hypothetical protein